MVDAISNVLEAIRQSADQYLQNIDFRDDGWVALTNLVGQDGSANESGKNKIVMCLYNITNETVISTYSPVQQSANGMYSVTPPLYINLFIMFMANFSGSQYGTGLAAISRLISFVQQNPYLTHATTPKLDPGINKIALELVSMNSTEVNYVMGMLGAKYLPSVFYKLRVIPFASSAMQAQVFPARGGDINETPKDPEPGQ